MTEGHLSNIFCWCNDLAAMRHFYTDLIGLKETFFNDEMGGLTYQSGLLQIVFHRAAAPIPVITEWANSPGYPGGTIDIQSWVISVPSAEYETVVARLKAADVPIFQPESREFHTGNSQFLVKDPMGTTIEIYGEDVGG